jgi:hypothetical protein
VLCLALKTIPTHQPEWKKPGNQIYDCYNSQADRRVVESLRSDRKRLGQKQNDRKVGDPEYAEVSYWRRPSTKVPPGGSKLDPPSVCRVINTIR